LFADDIVYLFLIQIQRRLWGRIIKEANERLAVKTVLGVLGPKRSVDEQLAINFGAGFTNESVHK
jgi:hypothetical protein